MKCSRVTSGGQRNCSNDVSTIARLAGDNDHELLARGFTLYDGLFAWLRFASDERHNWPAKAA